MALFGLGYVLGTRAGRERYAQLAALAQKAAVRLDERSGSGTEQAASNGAQGLAATPDPDGRLSEGVGVEAHVLARLLGMPLLRLHADVVLVPVRLRERRRRRRLVVPAAGTTNGTAPLPRTGCPAARRWTRRDGSSGESERELKALPAPVVPTTRRT